MIDVGLQGYNRPTTQGPFCGNLFTQLPKFEARQNYVLPYSFMTCFSFGMLVDQCVLEGLKGCYDLGTADMRSTAIA